MGAPRGKETKNPTLSLLTLYPHPGPYLGERGGGRGKGAEAGGEPFSQFLGSAQLPYGAQSLRLLAWLSPRVLLGRRRKQRASTQ